MESNQEKQVKIVYIGGAGRSGSTLLDRLLGQVDGFFSVGELKHFGGGKESPEDLLSGCGKPLNKCDFWCSVIEEVFGEQSTGGMSRLRALQYHTDRGRYTPLAAWKSLRSARYKKEFDEYVRVLCGIYRAIHKVSGCGVIVDSSSSPVHGLILNQVGGIDLRVVHLVRDSRAVVYSWQRKKIRPEVLGKVEYLVRPNPVRAALEWDFNNVFVHLLRRRNRQSLLVRYEELVADPRASLLRILTGLDETSCSIESFLDDHAADLKANHMVFGNPSRFEQGKTPLRLDLEWQHKMPAYQKVMAVALTFPLMRHYGYLR